MTLDFFKYMEVPSHPSLRGIVTHYRVACARYSTPLVLPVYSPIFQGLIFDLCSLDDIVLQKKEQTSLKHKVYFVAQAISPSMLLSSSSNLHIIAACFTPTAVFELTGVNLDGFTDQIVDAEAVFGKDINILYDRVMSLKDKTQALDMIDEYLCLKAKDRKRQNKSCVLTSLSLLNQHVGNISIEKLQKATNTTSRTLERSFKSEIGMSPKMYQRLLRFNQAKQYLEENPYAASWEVAVRFGFYDPSHFISEFRFFAGQTPKQYANERIMITQGLSEY